MEPFSNSGAILLSSSRLGSKLVILSGVGTGTESELTIPARAEESR
jgi:hypothetical protein